MKKKNLDWEAEMKSLDLEIKLQKAAQALAEKVMQSLEREKMSGEVQEKLTNVSIEKEDGNGS